MTKKITEKDKKDWKNFIDSNEKISDKDFSKKSLNLSKLEDTIDLHGYSLENANKIISEFIKVSFNKGTKKLNVITGKGTRSKEKLDPYKSETLSLLKYSVPEYIKSNSELMLKI